MINLFRRLSALKFDTPVPEYVVGGASITGHVIDDEFGISRFSNNNRKEHVIDFKFMYTVGTVRAEYGKNETWLVRSSSELSINV